METVAFFYVGAMLGIMLAFIWLQWPYIKRERRPRHSLRQSERLHAISLAAGAIRELPLSAEARAWLIGRLRG